MACIDQSLQSCGRIFGPNVNVVDKVLFENIKVETVFKAKSKVLVMPNSLDTSFLPLNPAQFNFTEIREIDDDE